MKQMIGNTIGLCLIRFLQLLFTVAGVLGLASTILYADHDTVVITAGEIEAMQAHTMADILNTVPGLSAGSSSVSIHGNYKVKVFVDGRPLNDPTSSHGAIKWDLVSPADIEKIEILRGKGGVRYGQDASGGVVLITTKEGNRISGNLKTFAGSEDRYYLNGNLQNSSGPWLIGLSGGYETNDGYLVNNDKERYQFGTKLGYTFHEQANVSVTADYSDDDRGYAGYPDYPTPFSRATSSMQAYSMQAELYRVKSKTYFNRGEKNNSDISRGLDNSIEVDDFGQEFDSNYATELWGEFNYGCGFYWSGASGTRFSDQEETTYSFYLIDSYALSSHPVSLTFGLRTNINSAFDNAYNPEAKITYKATKKSWKATLSYNRTNNTPSFYQRYNETSSTRPNPDLGMETADNFSFALFSMLSKSVGGSLTLFHNRLTDRITYTYGDNGTSQYQNVGSATYTGGDLSLTWSPAEQFKCKLNYTYLDPRDEDSDNDLPARPNHRGRLDLTYKPTEPFSMILTGRGSSSAYRNRSNTISIPGYLIGDFKMEYNFEHFSLFAEVTNILDKTYYYVDGLLGPPRAWFAGINWRF